MVQELRKYFRAKIVGVVMVAMEVVAMRATEVAGAIKPMQLTQVLWYSSNLTSIYKLLGASNLAKNIILSIFETVSVILSNFLDCIFCRISCDESLSDIVDGVWILLILFNS